MVFDAHSQGIGAGEMTEDDKQSPETGLTTQENAGAGSDDKTALQRIAVLSVLAGLCPVIPIPFVDDLALRFIRKRAIMAELDKGQVRPGRAQMDVYLQGPTQLMGCLTAVFIYPLKKIFKKIFIFLAIKDCVDAASQTFHELWMIRHAVNTAQLSQADLTLEPDGLMPLRRAVEATSQQIDTSPVNQVLKKGFSSSKALLRDAGRTLGNTIRTSGGTRANPEAVERAVDGVKPAEVGQMDELADQLGEQMWAERGYLTLLEQTFDENWKSKGPKTT